MINIITKELENDIYIFVRNLVQQQIKKVGEYKILTINWKQIYEIDNKWILILYDISKNHYVGLPVYNEEQENSIYIKSINKYVVLDEITDYNRTNIKRCIYIKGKPLKINNNEFNDILFKSKDTFLNYVKSNTDNTADGISYNKWCKDKLELMKKENNTIDLKVGAICWIDLGYNVGNELRKLRPAILWRSSSIIKCGQLFL